MVRFSNQRRTSSSRSFIISICVFCMIFLGFFLAVNDFSEDTKARQLESLENAIQRSIVYCYTLEGTYPESLEYIKENYGLVYNEELFFVDYHVLGSNIMPDVTIIERGKQP